MNDPIAIVLGLASLGYAVWLIKVEKNQLGWLFVLFGIGFFIFEYFRLNQ